MRIISEEKEKNDEEEEADKNEKAPPILAITEMLFS